MVGGPVVGVGHELAIVGLECGRVGGDGGVHINLSVSGLGETKTFSAVSLSGGIGGS